MNIRYKAPLLPGWEQPFGAPATDDMARLLERSRLRLSELERTIDEATQALTAARREHAVTHRTVVVVTALLEEIGAMRKAPTLAVQPQMEGAQALGQEAQPRRQSDLAPQQQTREATRRGGRWQWGLAAAGVSLLVAGATQCLAPGTWTQAANLTTAATRSTAR